jgi:hypothetical protein
MVKLPKESLLEQERFELKPKSGGGFLSYEVWGYQAPMATQTPPPLATSNSPTLMSA